MLSDVLSRLRNVLVKVRLSRRKDEEVEIQTSYGKVYQLKELKPYGLGSKPKAGKGVCLFVGGDSRSPVLLALGSEEGLPELEDGEVAIYSEYGNEVVLRKDGTLELNGTGNGGLLKWEELQSQLDKVTKILQKLQEKLQTPVNEPGNGSPSAFQAALLAALGTLQLPDYSQVESDKVLHGAGSSTGSDGNAVAGSGQESQASGDQEGSTLGDQSSDTVGIFELET